MVVAVVCVLFGKMKSLKMPGIRARAESGAAFGNDGMYLEKYVEDPRHIEIQVVGDQYGKVCHLIRTRLLYPAPSPKTG